MDFLALLLHFLLIGAFLFWIYNSSAKQDRYWLLLATLVKIAAGIAIGYIYINYFNGGDSVRYFEEAQKLAEIPEVSVWHVFTDNYDTNNSSFTNQPRARFFLKITYLLHLFTHGSFWLISIYFSLFSFLGALYFYVSVKRAFSIERTLLIVALFFWPSIIFWSGGIVKESVSLAVIYVIVGSFIRVIFIRRQVLLHLVFIVAGAFILFKIKYYYAAVLIPVLLSLGVSVFINERISVKNRYISLLGLFCVLGICIFISTHLHPNLNVEQIVKVMVNNYYLFEAKSEAGKMVVFKGLSPHITDLLYYSPKALFAGWFRPFPGDIKNIWSALSAVENLILFILLIFQLKNIRYLSRPVVMATLIYCLIMAVFLSYSAPNFGTLVRYKVGFSPFLLLLLIHQNPLLKWMKARSGI